MVGVVCPVRGGLRAAVEVEFGGGRAQRRDEREGARGVGFEGCGGGEKFGVQADGVAKGGADEGSYHAVLEGGAEERRGGCRWEGGQWIHGCGGVPRAVVLCSETWCGALLPNLAVGGGRELKG